MKQVTATLPPKLKNKNTQFFAWLLGFIFLCLVLVQLVRFEKFVIFAESMLSGAEAGKVIAAVIVVTEVFALPFLLRMRLSPLMRIFSMICGWLTALIWLWLAMTAFQEFVWLSIVLVILTGYVSYVLRGDIVRLSRK